MKKNSTVKQSPKQAAAREEGPMTIGMDLGDKTSRYCGLGGNGEVVTEGSVATTKKGMTQKFSGMRRCLIAIEVGTHSGWLSRLLKSLGFEVIVANARQVQLISASSRKNDLLAIRVRATLVEARTMLINAARGFTKAQGSRLPACDTDSMGVEKLEGLPEALCTRLRPLVEQVESLTEKIQKLDSTIEQIARTQYPETKLLQQVKGVGTLIALTFVLTVEDRERFQKSRDVGCYVGLRPKQSDSGESQPQLRITKEGDPLLRKFLVQGAHCIVSRGADTDLKRWGLKLAERGGKNAKKRAIVAVARKLAVLLHRLWVTGEVYEPLRNSQPARAKTKAA